jgi:hypothetical protein
MVPSHGDICAVAIYQGPPDKSLEGGKPGDP